MAGQFTGVTVDSFLEQFLPGPAPPPGTDAMLAFPEDAERSEQAWVSPWYPIYCRGSFL